MTNSIAQFTFIDLAGSPSALSQMVSTIARPGVEGHAVMLTGKRGTPFSLDSLVDVATQEAGQQIYETGYRSLINGEPQTMIWRDIDQSQFGVQFLVRSVELLSLRETLNQVGGLNSGSLAELRCRWQLLAVPETSQEETEE